jgi:hypothetical protein
MELFARLSYTYIAGEADVKSDTDINQKLNDKLIEFLKVHDIKQYRILNGQTSSIPKPAFGPGNESVQCSLNIAYEQPIKTK